MKIKKILKFKTKFKILFFNKKTTYPKIYKKKNKIFYFLINYQIFNFFFFLLKKNICNNKYIFNLKETYYYNLNAPSQSKFVFNKYNFFFNINIFNYIYLYNSFFKSYLFNFFFFFNKKKFQPFYLLFNFSKNKFFINLLDINKKIFFFVSSGFFIKFFEKKKSFKKNKLVKILMIKFLRKILILLQIKNMIFLIKNNPVNFLELINNLNQPIVHNFLNPFSGHVFKDSFTNNLKFSFNFFIFFKNQPYTFLKKKKNGRVKRKILRKIIIENKLVD